MAEFQRIHSEIDRTLSESHCIDESIDAARYILFSDHHRGRKDGADDFAACEATYDAALEYYFEEGFTLSLLGDVEEFWENPLWMVMRKYKDILKKERLFFKENRLLRIWGNHDDAWRYKDLIKRHFGRLFPRLDIYESITLNFNEETATKNILLIHGHQGNLESDRFSWISKIFVRLVWRNIQRLFRVPLSTPATDHKLKSDHDEAMFQWTDINDTVLICGHTHETVFMTPDDNPHRKLSYFNTGCCSYSNGNITGIEIADKKIRLIEWRKSGLDRVVLHELDLWEVLR